MNNDKRTFSALMAGMLAVLFLAATCALPASAQGHGQVQVLSNAVQNYPARSDVSPPLRGMMTPSSSVPSSSRVVPILAPKKPFPSTRPPGPAPEAPVPAISATLGLNFAGVSNTSVLNCPSVAGITVAPPDTNAAVGDTQVVEWVNLCYAIFDKSTGALVAGPFAGNNFWKGFGGVCEATNNGDPIIQWDKSNHRWMASQLVFQGASATCIAVSTSADATGTYNRYQFPQAGLIPDYPKWGLTPAVYYQTQNTFSPNFIGVNVCAYDATSMLKGSSKAKQVCILDNSNGTLFDDSMLPADLDSDPKKAKSAAEVLLGSIDNHNPESHVYEYVFTVNFKKPSKSTLAGVNGTLPIAVPSFFLGCGGFGACIQQPPPGDLLDSLGDRLMYRLARFDDGTNQHFLVTHSVNNTTALAARWYEFRAPSGSTALTLFQSGETPDDGEFRWMGSVAYDKAGDIALGYSRSSSASGDYPSIYYSGQTAGDPAGTTESEALIKQGSGSQTDTDDRWGDYSSMALDGTDFCTFWYAQEYYPATGSFAWATWLASLKFPGCQ